MDDFGISEADETTKVAGGTGGQTEGDRWVFFRYPGDGTHAVALALPQSPAAGR